jgi:hypothetical protein
MKAFLLDGDAIWFEECHKHFYSNNDRSFSKVGAIYFKGLYGSNLNVHNAF